MYIDFSESIRKLQEINFANNDLPSMMNFSDVTLNIRGYPFLFSYKHLTSKDDGNDIGVAGVIAHDEIASSGLSSYAMGSLTGILSMAFLQLPFGAIMGLVFSLFASFFGIKGLITWLRMKMKEKDITVIKMIEEEMHKYFSDKDIQSLSKQGTWFNLDEGAVYFRLKNKSMPFSATSYEFRCNDVQALRNALEDTSKKRYA